MDRRRAWVVGANAVGLLVVAIVLAIVALPMLLPGPGGEASPSPTSAAAPATAEPTHSPAASPAPSAPAPATTEPSPTPYAYRNPDGPSLAQVFDADDDDETFLSRVRLQPTFAGIWVDYNQVDFHIAVSADIEGIIAAIGHLFPRESTIYFHPAQHTHAELQAAADRVIADWEALRAEGLMISMVAVGEKENNVQVGIDPHTPEIVAELKRRYGDFVEFAHSPVGPPMLNTPWPTEPEVLVAVRAETTDQQLTCGSSERSFPASGLDAPTGAERAQGQVYDALRLALTTFGQEFVGRGDLTWRLAGMGETWATFLAETEWGLVAMDVRLDDGRWVPAGGGDCRLRVVLSPEYGPAEWELDGAPPGPAATELRILVHELACSSARPTSGRMSAPVAQYSADALVITIGVAPVPGMNTCPGAPGTPVLVRLPEPIGNRTLLDGGRYPPAPADQPYWER
jgi:hypothetical protein